MSTHGLIPDLRFWCQFSPETQYTQYTQDIHGHLSFSLQLKAGKECSGGNRDVIGLLSRYTTVAGPNGQIGRTAILFHQTNLLKIIHVKKPWPERLVMDRVGVLGYLPSTRPRRCMWRVFEKLSLSWLRKWHLASNKCKQVRTGISYFGFSHTKSHLVIYF